MLVLALPVVSVPEPRATLNPPATEPTDSLPPRLRPAPEEPVSATWLLAKRPAEPSVRVPAFRLTAVTSAVPFKDELAVTVIAPAPRLPATLPPPRA